MILNTGWLDESTMRALAPRIAGAPRTLAISHRHSLAGRDTLAWAEEAVNAGIDALQIRENDLSDRDLLELCLAVRKVVPRGVALLINGRLDIALAVDADGVHLPADSVPVDRLRRQYPDFLIGKSTHGRKEIVEARDQGVDYVVLGPIFPPRSKTQHRPCLGLEGLRRACDLGLPVLALGGLSLDRLPQVAAAGAAGIAGITLFQNRDELAEISRRTATLWSPRSRTGLTQ